VVVVPEGFGVEGVVVEGVVGLEAGVDGDEVDFDDEPELLLLVTAATTVFTALTTAAATLLTALTTVLTALLTAFATLLKKPPELFEELLDFEAASATVKLKREIITKRTNDLTITSLALPVPMIRPPSILLEVQIFKLSSRFRPRAADS
jgi:hypothetical protein